MLFNPCQPCCAFNVIGSIFGFTSFYRAAGFTVRNYPGGTAPASVNFNTNLTFIEWNHFLYTSDWLDVIRPWFNQGGKRLVMVSYGEQGTQDPLMAAVDAGHAQRANLITSTAAALGSGIVANPDPASKLFAGSPVCAVGTFNPHYLTQGLTTFQHANFVWDCVCRHNINQVGGEDIGCMNHSSAGTGTLLESYLGGSSLAIEKVNTPGGASEFLSFGDLMGTAIYPPTSGYSCDQFGTPPPNPCAGGAVYGCCYNTPQFMLNLATMGVQ